MPRDTEQLEDRIGRLQRALNHSLHMMRGYILEGSLHPATQLELGMLKREINELVGNAWFENSMSQDLMAANHELSQLRARLNLSENVDERTRSKIAEIKELRSITGYGLKESKDLVDLYGTADAAVMHLLNTMVLEEGTPHE